MTVPILDPETGREREVVTAFTVAYDNRDPHRAQQGAAWLVDAYPRENRRDRRELRRQRGEVLRARKPSACASTSPSWKAKLAEFKAKNAGQLPELTEVNLGSWIAPRTRSRTSRRRCRRCVASACS